MKTLLLTILLAGMATLAWVAWTTGFGHLTLVRSVGTPDHVASSPFPRSGIGSLSGDGGRLVRLVVVDRASERPLSDQPLRFSALGGEGREFVLQTDAAGEVAVPLGNYRLASNADPRAFAAAEISVGSASKLIQLDCVAYLDLRFEGAAANGRESPVLVVRDSALFREELSGFDGSPAAMESFLARLRDPDGLGGESLVWAGAASVAEGFRSWFRRTFAVVLFPVTSACVS